MGASVVEGTLVGHEVLAVAALTVSVAEVLLLLEGLERWRHWWLSAVLVASAGEWLLASEAVAAELVLLELLLERVGLRLPLLLRSAGESDSGTWMEALELLEGLLLLTSVLLGHSHRSGCAIRCGERSSL